jgi:hypothetical protein
MEDPEETNFAFATIDIAPFAQVKTLCFPHNSILFFQQAKRIMLPLKLDWASEEVYASGSLPEWGITIRIKYPAIAYAISAARVAKSTTYPENFQSGRILANGATSGAVIP